MDDPFGNPEQFVEAVKKQAATKDINLVAGELAHALTALVVAYMVGHDRTAYVLAWAEGKAFDILDGEAAKLRAAYEAWLVISKADSVDIARAWFLGMNHLLGDTSPAGHIRKGDLHNVVTAAWAYLANDM